MKTLKKLMWCALLVGAVTGCRTLGSRPTPSPCPEPEPTPKAPVVQPLPPNAELPRGATQLVVGLCVRTGEYLALGVNPGTRSFAYAVSGARGTSEAFFAKVHRSGIPMTLFTAPVKVSMRGSPVRTPAPDEGTTHNVPAPQDNQGDQGGGEGTQKALPPYDPCTNQQNEIGEKPPPDPDDEGGVKPTVPRSFASLAWMTANAVDSFSAPAPESGKTPPAGTTVPR